MMADYVRRGAKHPNARLTEEQVAMIRAWYAQGQITMRELAETYQVTLSTIWRVLHRQSYANGER